MVRSAIQVAFGTAKDLPNMVRSIGVSIDPSPAPSPTTALPPDFPKSQPRKVWITWLSDWALGVPYNYDWSEVLDLQPGKYAVTVGVDAPPGNEWLVAVFIYAGRTIYIPFGVGNMVEVNSQNPVQVEFEVSPDAQDLQYGRWVFSVEEANHVPGPLGGFFEGCVECCLKSEYWAYRCIADWSFCSVTAGRAGCSVLQNPSIGNWLTPRVRIHYDGPFWVGLNPAISIPIVNSNLHTYMSPTAQFWSSYGRLTIDFYYSPPKQCPQAYLVNMQPFTNARPLSSEDSITLNLYHIENDAPTLEQFYYGKGFLDKMKDWTIPATPDDTTTLRISPDTRCPKPPTKYVRWFLDPYETVVWLQAPTDIRPGRRIFASYVVYADPKADPDAASLPFVEVPETYDLWRHISGRPFGAPYAKDQWGNPTVEVIELHEFPITPLMIEKGGFTVQVGHYVVGEGSDLYLMSKVIDDEHFYSFELGTFLEPINAMIRSADLQIGTPTIGAAIRSVDLQVPRPEIGAAITSVDLQIGKPTVGAAIRGVDLQVARPPIEVATVYGRVLSMLGPVADAEVSLNGKYTAKTAADGSFRIENVPFGEYTLTVKPTRLFPPERFLLKSTSKKISVLTTEMPPIILTLPVNYLNMGIMGAGTIGAVIAAKELTKPKYPYYY
jgi:hypothetical protein